MDLKKTGELLTSLRKQKKVSQEQLAQEMHVSRQAVSYWERGKRLPDPDNLLPLAQYYGITVTDLLEGEIHEKKQDTKDIQKMIEFSNQKIKEKDDITAKSIAIVAVAAAFMTYYLFQLRTVSLAIALLGISAFSHFSIRRRSARLNLFLQTAAAGEMAAWICAYGYDAHFFYDSSVSINISYFSLLGSFAVNQIYDLVFVIIILAFFWYIYHLTEQNNLSLIRNWMIIHHTETELLICWLIIITAYILHWQFPLCGLFAAMTIPFMTASSVFIFIVMHIH
jgi:transcriptional regulator with XRE-family HTH domain